VRVQAIVEPGVERVVFHLDGRRRQAVERPPFVAALDFGRLPVPRRVEAVGFDADGAEVGRDALVVNSGGGRLRVRITDPRGPRAVGAVDVGLAVEVPEGEALDRVDVYWRDQLAASLFQAPFRHRLRIPRDDAEGFLRAVVRLADGTQAEDVLYLNGPLAAERVDVQLNELYVVVTDRDGHPVRGLGPEDFVVREEGELQEVETFSDAGDLPITVGLAIDSSASMFVKLPEVQEAAAEFVAGLEAGRDRAFLVDFDDQIRLAAAPTRDLPAVLASGGGMVADGRTSLWKAIVYSLVQIQGVPGRKALIVYSDGADEDEDFPYRNALDFARKVGVPIYVIVSNDEAVRTGGIPIGFPSLGRRLHRLAEEVGGRVWLVRRGDDLAGIYRLIQEELSAQYLLGYYPGGDGWGAWRRVEVDVRRPGLQARTLAGYER
jgi:VWFA-related protein